MPVSDAVLDGQIDTHSGVDDGGAGALHTQSKIACVQACGLPVFGLKCVSESILPSAPLW